MKVGDLIYAVDNHCTSDESCWCFFCAHQSSRVGIVVERLNETGVNHSAGYWSVMFDVGDWRLYGCEMEVIQ